MTVLQRDDAVGTLNDHAVMGIRDTYASLPGLQTMKQGRQNHRCRDIAQFVQSILYLRPWDLVMRCGTPPPEQGLCTTCSVISHHIDCHAFGSVTITMPTVC